MITVNFFYVCEYIYIFFFIFPFKLSIRASQVALVEKNLPANVGDADSNPG